MARVCMGERKYPEFSVFGSEVGERGKRMSVGVRSYCRDLLIEPRLNGCYAKTRALRAGELGRESSAMRRMTA